MQGDERNAILDALDLDIGPDTSAPSAWFKEADIPYYRRLTLGFLARA
jgi:hypothetical protein